MMEMHLDRIDILKIDIEGAEKEVFESSSKWIDKVSVIMTELHDQIRPGSARAFSEATQGFDVVSSKGETIACHRSINLA
jgi:hypothetical protein